MKLMDMVASLSLDSSGFDAGLNAASKSGNSFASGLRGTLGGAVSFVGSTVASVASQVTTLMLDAAKATASIAQTIVQSSLEEYADTEQLYGGVETLFGEHASIVIANANEAFRTAGMSANDYMQNVMNFSSRLLQGLGGDTEKAAYYADMALKDMADNANKFGTDMAMIEYAYQGFSRGNFMMLDNLKLGYGGTAAEMARLINDSGVMGDTIVTAATVAQVPLDKMFEAIHIIQQQMGITGTTAEEAANTITGSFNSFTATWRNLLSGLANDDASIDALVDNLWEAGNNLVSNVANLVPRIGQNAIIAFDKLLSKWDIYNDIKDAFREEGLSGAFEVLSTHIKSVFAEWGPIAYTAGTDLLASIYSGITGSTITGEQFRVAFEGVWAQVYTSVDNVVTYAGGILGSIYTALTGDAYNKTSITTMLAGLWNVATSAGDTVITYAGSFFGKIYEALTGKALTAQSIKDDISGLFSVGTAAGAVVVTYASEFVGKVYEAITGQSTTINSVKDLISSLWTIGTTTMDNVLTATGTFISSIYTALTGQEGTAENIRNSIGGLFDAGVTKAGELVEYAKGFFGSIYSSLTSDSFNLTNIKMLVGGLWNLGTTMGESLITFTGSLLGSIYTALTGQDATALDIQSVVGGLFSVGVDKAGEVIEYAKGFFASVFSSLSSDSFNLTNIKMTVQSLWSSGRTVAESLVTYSGTLLGSIYTALTGEDATGVSIKGIISGLFDVGVSAANGVFDVARTFISTVWSAISGESLTSFSIESTVGGLFGIAIEKAEMVFGVAKGFFSSIYNSLMGEDGKATAIMTKVGGIFATGYNAAVYLKNYANTFLGELYTALTGQEYTPENVGATLAGIFTGVVDAGAAAVEYAKTFLGKMFTAITGEDATAHNIKVKLGGLFVSVSSGMSGIIDGAKSFLGKIFTGITGQEATAENIKSTLSGLFSTAGTAMGNLISGAENLVSSIAKKIDMTKVNEIATNLGTMFGAAKDAVDSILSTAGSLVGNLWEKLTGQEATAANVGAFLGDMLDMGLDALNNTLTTAATFWQVLETKLGSAPVSLTDVLEAPFEAMGVAMTGALNDAGHFIADLYGALTGDKEGAANIDRWIDEMFHKWTYEEYIAHTTDAANQQGTWGDLMDYAQAMYANPSMYGVTEQQVSDWIDALNNNSPFQAEYKAAADAVWAAYSAGQERQNEIHQQQLEIAQEAAEALAQGMVYKEGTDDIFGDSNAFKHFSGRKLKNIQAEEVTSATQKAAAVINAYNASASGDMPYLTAPKAEVEDNTDALRALLPVLQQLPGAIAAALSGVSITADGRAIGQLASTYMSRQTQSKLHTMMGVGR